MSETFTLGMDFGGTYLRAGLVNRHGDVMHFTKVESRAAAGRDEPLDAIETVARELMAQAEVVGLGIGCPGVIDPDTGVLVGRTPHLPHWEDLGLRDLLARRLSLPVLVDNDANFVALGEQRRGAGRGARVLIVVTVGTGVGCGIVVEGRVFHGARGGAGEVGHLPLGDGSLECRCGVTDCVEPEMSGSGLARQAETLGLEPREATALFAAAERGELIARSLTERMADRLGAAIGTAVNLLNPDRVVIGGGLTESGEFWLAKVREALERYGLESHRRGLSVATASLGGRAGVVGAGLAAWDEIPNVSGTSPSAGPNSRDARPSDSPGNR